MREISTDAIHTVPGWFTNFDIALFRFFLEQSRQQVGSGDLAELGVYQGKSAVLIGSDLRPGETFTVIDLFEDEAAHDRNAIENQTSYKGLTRQTFEGNYLRLHGELPVVIQGFSETIVDHARHGTHRFVHIDASHLYEHVVHDIDAARVLVAPQAVVVFDDIRAPHTPGVPAAVWRACGVDLHPIAITESKLYATFGDPVPYHDALEAEAATNDWWFDRHQIGPDELLRLPTPKTAPPAAEEQPEPEPEPQPEPAPTEEPAEQSRRRGPLWKPYVPPALHPATARVVATVKGMRRG